MSSAPIIETEGCPEENPLFFMSDGTPLYGVFHPTRADRQPDCVLVFCHSLGIEHMVAQRMQALGARAAVNAGFAAFRYDSRAHGDSAGDPANTTFADLVDDACAAADYARWVSGASRIVWVGVRFGCLIAASAIARRDDAAALALWEPLHQGSEYFRAAIRTLLFCQVAQGKRSTATVEELFSRLEAEGTLPIAGTYLYSALMREAKAADLERSLQNWAGATLLAQIQRRPTLSTNNERLRLAVERRGGKVTVALVSQEPAWGMLPLVRPQWTSDSLLDATTEWLHGLE